MKKSLLYSFLILVFALSATLVGCAGTSSYSRASYIAPDGTSYAFTEISEYDLAADKILEQVSVSTVPTSEEETLIQRKITFDDYTIHANFYQSAVLIFFPSDLSYKQVKQITEKLCSAYDDVIKDCIMSEENGSSLLKLSDDLTLEKYDALIDTLKVKLKALTSESKAQAEAEAKAKAEAQAKAKAQASTQNKSQSSTTTQSKTQTTSSSTTSSGTKTNSGSTSSTQEKAGTNTAQSSSSSKTSSTQKSSASSSSSSKTTTSSAASTSTASSSSDEQETESRHGLSPFVIVLIVLAAIALVVFILKLIFG